MPFSALIAAVVPSLPKIIDAVVDASVDFLGKANSLHDELEMARFTSEQQRLLEEKCQQAQQEINERNLQFQGEESDKARELLNELALRNHEIRQLEIRQLMITFQREATLKLPEVNTLYETWPLRIAPLQLLHDQPNVGNPPLKVIIAPPEVDSDKFGGVVAGVPKLEKGLAEGLRNFLGEHYPLEHAQRSVEFLGGAWDAQRFHGEVSINALFNMLNSEAMLVLESEIDGGYFNMRVLYWAAGQARYTYAPVVIRFPYRELVYESAKNRALQWENLHDWLLEQGKNPKLFNEIDTYNLEVLRENAQLAEFGVDISQLPPRYKLCTEDFEPLNQFLMLSHCLVAGLLIDVHHLVQHGVPPALPQWLQAFIAQGVGAESLQPMLDAFHQALQGLTVACPAWASDAGQDQYGRYADLNVSGVEQRFRWIAAGTFMMGSPPSEAERSSNETQHEVTLSKGYWLADTACTQALWQVVMGNNPVYFRDNANNPVECVSWNDVQAFIQKLNGMVSGLAARLPTEAEWEYACRAGTTTAYSCGDSITAEQANFGSNVGRTMLVKAFSPNAWGLYQMHGNVWEWCQDTWDSYDNTPTDGRAGTSGNASRRVLRGGSWYAYPGRLRSAYRHNRSPDFRDDYIGFRLVVSPP